MAVPTGTLSATFATGFLFGARRLGQDIAALLRRAELDERVFEQPGRELSGVQMQRLFNEIITTLDDLYMGFVTERYKPIANFAALKVAADADTLGESIRTRITFRESLRDDVHYGFVIDERYREFSLTLDDFDLVPGASSHLFYWLRMMTIFRYHSWLIGRTVKLNRVTFTGGAPEGEQRHLDLFNARVDFNQSQNAVYFENKYLNFPVVRSEAEILANNVFIQYYPNFFEIPGHDLSLTGQVEDVFKSLQKEGEWHPSIDRVAKRLGINARTLREQLAKENEKFQQIKARTRKEAAIHKLLSTSLPVSTLAWELGFAEPGDFSRDFKHWTGLSPSAYRRQYGNP